MPELYKDRLVLLIGQSYALALKKIADHSCKLMQEDKNLFFDKNEREQYLRVMKMLENAIDDDKNHLKLTEKQIEELKKIYINIAENLSTIAINQEIVLQGGL